MANTDIQLLKLAFTYHMIEQVIGADTELRPTEMTFLEEHFPAQMLHEVGFIDQAGHLSQSFRDAAQDALQVLPAALTEGEKLAMIEILVDASAADKVLTPEEADVLAGGAQLLGVPADAWMSHLRALQEAGQVELE